jgi:hypothetical protein
MRRLVFEFDEIDGPEAAASGATAGADDLAALERYARELADGMSDAFPFRFGGVYLEADGQPVTAGPAWSRGRPRRQPPGPGRQPARRAGPPG